MSRHRSSLRASSMALTAALVPLVLACNRDDDAASALARRQADAEAAQPSLRSGEGSRFDLRGAAAGPLSEAAATAEAAEASAVGSAAAERGDTIDLRGVGYRHGSEEAAVVVIEFSDFGCPYCAQFARQIYPEIHREFIATGKVQWRYVPFALGIFRNGESAALAAECAGDQGRFWEMHDLLYERQSEWKASGQPGPTFGGYGRDLGLDQAAFALCMAGGDGTEVAESGERSSDMGMSARARLDRSNALTRRIGIRATPSFVVDGRLLEGALPVQHFRALLLLAVERRASR